MCPCLVIQKKWRRHCQCPVDLRVAQKFVGPHDRHVGTRWYTFRVLNLNICCQGTLSFMTSCTSGLMKMSWNKDDWSKKAAQDAKFYRLTPSGEEQVILHHIPTYLLERLWESKSRLSRRTSRSTRSLSPWDDCSSWETNEQRRYQLWDFQGHDGICRMVSQSRCRWFALYVKKALTASLENFKLRWVIQLRWLIQMHVLTQDLIILGHSCRVYMLWALAKRFLLCIDVWLALWDIVVLMMCLILLWNSMRDWRSPPCIIVHVAGEIVIPFVFAAKWPSTCRELNSVASRCKVVSRLVHSNCSPDSLSIGLISGEYRTCQSRFGMQSQFCFRPCLWI